MAPKKKAKVFVSYSRHDEALVRPLAGLLGVAADDAVFLDVTSLKPGQLWEKEIFDALKDASVFVLCWCCESEKSRNVAKEIAAALSDESKRLVPVLFCGAPLPSDLKTRQWTDLRGKVVHQCTVPHFSDKAEQDDFTQMLSVAKSHHGKDLVYPTPPPDLSGKSFRILKYCLAVLLLTFSIPIGIHYVSYSFSHREPDQNAKTQVPPSVVPKETSPQKPTGVEEPKQSQPLGGKPYKPQEGVQKGPTISASPVGPTAVLSPQRNLPENHKPAHPVEKPSRSSPTTSYRFTTIGWVLAAVIIACVIVVFVQLRKALSEMKPQRPEESDPDDIVAKAKSYFEGLAER